jgi:hypothetical protein
MKARLLARHDPLLVADALQALVHDFVSLELGGYVASADEAGARLAAGGVALLRGFGR